MFKEEMKKRKMKVQHHRGGCGEIEESVKDCRVAEGSVGGVAAGPRVTHHCDGHPARVHDLGGLEM